MRVSCAHISGMSSMRTSKKQIEIGNYLREYRQRAGISQTVLMRWLADAGISACRARISRYEGGSRTIPPAVARVFEVRSGGALDRDALVFGPDFQD